MIKRLWGWDLRIGRQIESLDPLAYCCRKLHAGKGTSLVYINTSLSLMFSINFAPWMCWREWWRGSPSHSLFGWFWSPRLWWEVLGVIAAPRRRLLWGVLGFIAAPVRLSESSAEIPKASAPSPHSIHSVTDSKWSSC